MPNDQRVPGDGDDQANPSVPTMIHKMLAAQLREFAEEAQQLRNEVEQRDTPHNAV
jgi:hypothetical protein